MKTRLVRLGCFISRKSCRRRSVYFLSPSIKVFVFVNATRIEQNHPQYKKVLFFVSQFASEGKIDEGEEFLIAEETVKFVRYISAGLKLKYLRKCVSDRI